ncbi:MAG: hypothetical protein A4E43_01547 [Methanosaeta sp. PtaB.Bin005]|nr:MAG: hypothetical protein A4E43_01547 [Methanosaeta sp. PtaB.Bin005]
MMVVQLGLVVRNPSQPLFSLCTFIISRCSWLHSGMRRGTSSTMRYELVLLATAQPAAAKAGSTDMASAAGRAEKTISASTSLGSTLTTVISAMSSGSSLSRRHFAASRYFLPALLSDAARLVSSNQGWLFSPSMKRCPTAPVAPKTPALILAIINHLNSDGDLS